jgi:glutaminyl-peptide cyclotransferase
MVGDTDLNIFMESNSDPEINSQIWLIAKNLDYEDFFISDGTVSILDDHTPFLEKGIRAVDIIDIKYPYWHTTEDTADKVSAQSLEIVGRTLEEWLTNIKP